MTRRALATAFLSFSLLPAVSAAAPEKEDFLFLDNGTIRLGVKKSSGAGIAWLSASGSDKNLLDHYDRGRLVQQSYYGKHDGTVWMDQPWTWNPVQGGDWKGGPAKVLELKADKTTLYAKTMGRHWSGCVDLPEATFEEWITLRDKLAHVRFRFTHSGAETHPARDQEIPAMFTEPHLTELVIYDGDKPWTGGALSRSSPGWPNEARQPTEKWAAWVGKDDSGVGLYVPAMEKLTCYRFGANPDAPAACSYCAPLVNFAITPGKVFEYEAWLTFGKTEEIRAEFRGVRDSQAAAPPEKKP